MSSISLLGRVRVLGTSRKEDKVFTPEGLVDLTENSGSEEMGRTLSLEYIRGAGGGGGKGDVFFNCWILSL